MGVLETPPSAGPGALEKNKNDPKQQQKQRVGVADYFAILGVGEELVWKHAQQKLQVNEKTSAAAPEEDDAMLLERFYREIVDCSIVVVEEPSTESRDPKTTLLYTTTSKHSNHHYAVAIPSPSPSDVNSGVGPEVDTIEFEGWTLVQQTRPASAPQQFHKDTLAASQPLLWNKGTVWDANLDPIGGLTGEIKSLEAEALQKQLQNRNPTPLKDLRRKVQSTFQQRAQLPRTKKIFYLRYRRRAPDQPAIPAIANVELFFVRIHKSTLDTAYDSNNYEKSSTGGGSSIVSQKRAAALLRVAEAGKQAVQSRVLGNTPVRQPPPLETSSTNTSLVADLPPPVALDSFLKLPTGFDEWKIPKPYKAIYPSSRRPDNLSKTVLFPGDDNNHDSVEAVEKTSPEEENWEDRSRPRLVGSSGVTMESSDDEFIYVPVLAIRRQRIGEEERFMEDPAVVDISVSFLGKQGEPVLPSVEVDPFEEEEEGMSLLDKTEWTTTNTAISSSIETHGEEQRNSRSLGLGTTCLLVQRNIPLGFCDAAFSTSVLDRFPYKNYKGLPLPEEELPMFCYPTGCRLHRAKFSDAPLPQYYGFVVKNERGDSIYVSCVSFMEPLTNQKQKQLARLSEKRRRVSLPHARFWARRLRRLRRRQPQHLSEEHDQGSSIATPAEWTDNCEYDDDETDFLLTGFDQMTTFENKTICLVSRYPYWTAFRRFLSHLHSVSGSSSDLPLERYISHLLLTVPIPKPGGPAILIPLPTFNEPMVLCSPPSKDLPVLDLPFERLLSCLDVPTIVTIVLGFLALERKVIVMSTRPSLVLDVCELLRSLLFPFDLCAPYVPRLTEPFMSCLDFPGAIFVGIHDDGTPTGLAAVVRKNMPEDSTIVDLDSGSVDCSGDGITVLNSSWGVIPPGPRSVLVSEIETLSRDAGIVPGQEPLDSQIDSAFEASTPAALVEDEIRLSNTHREPLDDRAIRDAFLRFFCSVFGGYERYLVVPDVDFLISGNEWFDAKGFLASASEEKAAFLGALVSTQLFQSFIQRRTEASDVHCLLFDECLAEFHSAPIPYGRLGGDVETVQGNEHEPPQLMYSLLVDQSAAETQTTIGTERSFDADSRPGSDTDSSGHHLIKSFLSASSVSDRMVKQSDFAVNASGDWVTVPSRHDLTQGIRFIYCVDGNPTFPDRLNPSSYLPRQPESWLVEMSTVPTPMLTRSDKEVEEADRRRKVATSYRGLQSQRRCLWQLPKLMGSHFLGTWLLCVPALVAQPLLSYEQQSRYLLRALGALRLLRSKQRIVPDEAAYRALIVACGRTKNDRRMELVKLFGLLRSDGIFPSAVTLGQYTRALAEGYSKQSIGTQEEDQGSGEAESSGRYLKASWKFSGDAEVALSALDPNLAALEDAGRRWRQKHNQEKERENGQTNDEPSSSQDPKASQSEPQKKRTSHRPWLPVVLSPSFVPSRQDESGAPVHSPLSRNSIRLVAIWSRTKSCDSCGYIPLEEEIQAGWDVLGGENDVPGSISCPRCGVLLIPMLGYKELSLDEALIGPEDPAKSRPCGTEIADFASLPVQIGHVLEDTDASYVTYVSPASMRSSLERRIREHGETVLERENLRAMDPELFFNLWWYCARFSLPLPLPVSVGKDSTHYCTIAAWDHRVALRGCHSCALVLTQLLGNDSEDSFCLESAGSLELLGDYPLMSRFNLQGYYSTVWDHDDLSEILVTLVEACDKRDFKPVVECVLRCNKRRRDKYGGALSTTSGSDVNSSYSIPVTITDSENLPVHSMELDCYRTILYLAKYQCTTAFHAFFPATLKPCKGYHYWCPIAPLPIFDRLLREAVKRARMNKENAFAPMHDVSDVALGFRSVFGHLV